MKILVINPGSTSTKIAIYQEETEVYTETIHHEPADLAPFSCVLEQLDYRKALILSSVFVDNIRTLPAPREWSCPAR